VGAAHVPLFALAVCGKDECAFFGAYENTYSAHASSNDEMMVAKYK
jgi:hypothetical protein